MVLEPGDQGAEPRVSESCREPAHWTCGVTEVQRGQCLPKTGTQVFPTQGPVHLFFTCLKAKVTKKPGRAPVRGTEGSMGVSSPQWK
jgi:hypothetical protein